jgi:leucyl aminopeptidase
VLNVRVVTDRVTPDVLAVPVLGGDDRDVGEVLATACSADTGVRDEALALVDELDHRGKAGVVHLLPRPLRRPGLVLLAGVGTGDEAGWRAAGAALARAARRQPSLAVGLPAGVEPDAVRGLAEGALLASYRYRLGADREDAAPRLRTVTLIADEPARVRPAVELAREVARATGAARDLTNTPSDVKSPAWFAARMVRAAATRTGLSVVVLSPAQLRDGGFGGILAVGGGSSRGPRLVHLKWAPRGADRHVVLVGKGITFDTGGLDLKQADGMKLMRKDMAGGAAVAAATIAVAALGLPVRVDALIPLAENMPGADAYRPGDVVHHYGGLTSEIRNTDAEGRVVLADALAYAVRTLRPDYLVDLATLTGAAGVALGKRTAALFTENDSLAQALDSAATAAGERVWRMPMPADYAEPVRGSDIADVINSTDIGAGSVTAALFLREFVGTAADRWAHLDMSAPAWSDSAEGELVKGATGWGVRTLLRWLATLAPDGQAAPR